MEDRTMNKGDKSQLQGNIILEDGKLSKRKKCRRKKS